MFKRIREWNRKRKARKAVEKFIEYELLETMVDLCMYLEWDAHFSHRGRYDNLFRGHADRLKTLSMDYRDLEFGGNHGRE